MAKIISSPNCGNSPKMEFIKEFNIAIVKGDTNFILDSVTNDIIWTIIGDQKYLGKENFTKALDNMKNKKVKELKIDQILSHGKSGAANGVMTMQDDKKYAYADFYVFQGAKGEKIKSISTYIIEI